MENLGKRLEPGLDRVALRHFEGVEAAALHEEELVAQHLPDRAQLALVAVALAQQARIAIGAAVGEFGKFERDQREAGDVAGDRGGMLPGLELDADRRAARQKLVLLALPPLETDDDGAGRRQSLVVGQELPVVLGELSLLNERHKASP